MDLGLPDFPGLDWVPVEAYASSSQMTASLQEVPKLLSRTTHVIPRIAQAIMTHIGLHFTATGFTTRLVDNIQQPNIQGVSAITLHSILFHSIDFSTSFSTPVPFSPRR